MLLNKLRGSTGNAMHAKMLSLTFFLFVCYQPHVMSTFSAISVHAIQMFHGRLIPKQATCCTRAASKKSTGLDFNAHCSLKVYEISLSMTTAMLLAVNTRDAGP